MTRGSETLDDGGAVDVGGGSQRGALRARNEDEFAWFADGRILALADGMGERPHGGVASSIVMHEVSTIVNTSDLTSSAIEALDGFGAVSWIRQVFGACRGRLATAKATIAEVPAMESALMVALLTREQLVVGHVGHSRCYLWRRGKLTQVTHDHRLVPPGLESLEEDERRAIQSLVCVADRGIGDALGDDPEITTSRVERGDIILLCSNGLSDAVPAGILVEVLHPDLSAKRNVQAVLDAATRAHADDDTTVVVVRVGPA